MTGRQPIPDWLCPRTLEWVASQMHLEILDGDKRVAEMEDNDRRNPYAGISILIRGWRWRLRALRQYRRRLRHIATRITTRR